MWRRLSTRVVLVVCFWFAMMFYLAAPLVAQDTHSALKRATQNQTTCERTARTPTSAGSRNKNRPDLYELCRRSKRNSAL